MSDFCVFISHCDHSHSCPSPFLSYPVVVGELNEQLFGCLAGSWEQPTAIRNLSRKLRWKSVNGFTSLFLYLHVCLLFAVTAQGKVVSTWLCAHSCVACDRCKPYRHSPAEIWNRYQKLQICSRGFVKPEISRDFNCKNFFSVPLMTRDLLSYR